MNLTRRILFGLALVFVVNAGFLFAVIQQNVWPADLEVGVEGISFVYRDKREVIYPHFFVGSAEEMRTHYHKNKRQYFSDRASVYRYLEQRAEHQSADTAASSATADDAFKSNTDNWYKSKYLTTSFWWRLAVGLLAVIAAYIVWVARPASEAGAIFLFSSVMLMLCQWSSALDAVSSVFFLNPIFAWLVSLGNGIGTIGYACFGSICVIYFPAALDKHRRYVRIVSAVFTGALAVVAFNGLETGVPLYKQLYLDNHYLYVCALMAYPFILYFCIQQWRASAANAARRALSNWVTFSWLFGPGVFLALHALPSFIGIKPLIPRSMASFALYTNFVFMLIALARLPYLQLEKHVGFILRWMAVVCLLFVLELGALRLLNGEFDSRALLIVVIGIALYLPLRELLIKRLSQKRRKLMSARFADASALLTRASMQENENQQKVWESALDILFEPIAIRAAADDHITRALPVTLNANHTGLIVHATTYTSAVYLEHPDRGERLFDKQDLALVESIAQLFGKLQTLRNSYQKGQKEERDRIRTDLHDQISHNLINLIYASNDSDTRDIAQTILEDLRSIIAALGSESATARVFSDRMESIARRILDACSIKLDFSAQIEADLVLSPAVSLNVLNSLRELLTNTIKHAQASRVTIALQVFADKCLRLQYADDGRGIESRDTESCFSDTGQLGLSNIARRISALGGQFDVRRGGSFQSVIELQLT